MTREDVVQYRDCVDAFGVGGAIASAPVIDFALDIVEIGGTARAKRGKRSGIKQVFACRDGSRVTLPAARKGPKGAKPLLEAFIRNGKVVRDSYMQDARKRLLIGLKKGASRPGG